jgi:exopolysaccharide production protein ExoQ
MVVRTQFASAAQSSAIATQRFLTLRDFVDWLLCSFSFTMLLLIQWSTRFPGATFFVTVLFMLPWGVVILRQLNASIKGVVANWPLFVLPCLALASVLWSDYSDWTLRASIQYLATIVIGVLAASCIKPQMLLAALLTALTLVAALSVVDGSVQASGAGGERVLVGLFGSKNYFALSVSLLLMVAIAVIIDKSQSLGFRRFAFVASIFALGLLGYTRSAGIMVVTAAMLAVISILQLAKRLAPLHRIAALISLVLLGVCAIVIGVFFVDELPDLLSYMGKDVTLTGRTFLWERAFASIAEQPVLGVGYQAFWQVGNWGAEELWLRNGITGKYGFHFHDIYLQIAVDLGLTGLLVFIAMLLTIVARVVTALSTTLRSEQMFAICAFIFFLLRTPIEVDMFFQFEISTIIMCLIWIYIKPNSAIRTLA